VGWDRAVKLVQREDAAGAGVCSTLGARPR
jgi:hypothetical protein